VRHAFLRGPDRTEIGAVDAVAEGPAAVALSRGGARKRYAHAEPNEDAALFALGAGGLLLAVADGHDGAWGAEQALEFLLAESAPRWTGEAEMPASRWAAEARAALVEIDRRIALRAQERGGLPAATTLSIALLRPDEGHLLHASAGDSHVFAVGDGGARDLGWRARASGPPVFLGAGLGDPAERTEAGKIPLAGLRATVLATDGLSERGIGVDDPAAAALAAVEAARSQAPDRRPLSAARGVVEAALGAQRRQRAGDNVATAVWLA